MKRQTDGSIKAHLLRSGLILLSLLAVCVIPFALAQRNSVKQNNLQYGDASSGKNIAEMALAPSNIITVTNTNDSGAGSLREALAALQATRRNAFGQNPLGCPTLGNYPNTTVSLSAGTAVTPDAPPTNTTSIDVSTSTNFDGTLEGDPTTGVVRVTDAHPAGTYTVTVRAFIGECLPATTTFTLTVTTPVTCVPVSFAAA